MRRAGPVTGFAALAFELIARIQTEHFGVNRMRPVAGLLSVAGNTGLLADIGRI